MLLIVGYCHKYQRRARDSPARAVTNLRPGGHHAVTGRSPAPCRGGGGDQGGAILVERRAADGGPAHLPDAPRPRAAANLWHLARAQDRLPVAGLPGHQGSYTTVYNPFNRSSRRPQAAAAASFGGRRIASSCLGPVPRARLRTGRNAAIRTKSIQAPSTNRNRLRTPSFLKPQAE